MPDAPRQFRHGVLNRRRIGSTKARRLAGTTLQNKRAEILGRDLYICRACRRVCLPADLELDHVRPLSQGGTHADGNLQTLCLDCHTAKTDAEAAGGLPED